MSIENRRGLTLIEVVIVLVVVVVLFGLLIPAIRNSHEAVRYFGPVQPTGKLVSPKTQLKAGDRVLVEWNGTWWQGQVLKVLPDGTVKIHYVGWDAEYDEVATRTRLLLPANFDSLEAVRLIEQVQTLRNPVTPMTQLGPVQPSGKLVSQKTQLKAGDRVLVEWNGTWWEGQVLKVLPDGNVKIHYVGWDAHYDEVATRTRLLLPAKKTVNPKNR